MQIDAVEQRTGEAVLIIGDAARIRAALAHEARIVGAAAAAGIYRRDQHEARRIRDAMIGARDRDFAGLERLAQRIQNLRREFRQLIEKQHAVMRERDFARPRAQAAADERGHAGGMMRRAERAAAGQRAVGDLARDRRDHRNFEEFLRQERRQDRGQARRQHGFAGARRAAHQKVMSAGGGHFERALCRFPVP